MLLFSANFWFFLMSHFTLQYNFFFIFLVLLFLSFLVPIIFLLLYFYFYFQHHFSNTILYSSIQYKRIKTFGNKTKTEMVVVRTSYKISSLKLTIHKYFRAQQIKSFFVFM